MLAYHVAQQITLIIAHYATCTDLLRNLGPLVWAIFSREEEDAA